MTAITQEWTPDRLRILPEDSLRSLVLDTTSESDPRLWAVLTGPEFRESTAIVLAAIRRDTTAQIAARESSVRALQPGPGRDDLAAVAAHLAAARERDEWLPKVIRYRRLAERCITAFEVATGITVGGPVAGDDEPDGPTPRRSSPSAARSPPTRPPATPRASPPSPHDQILSTALAAAGITTPSGTVIPLAAAIA